MTSIVIGMNVVGVIWLIFSIIMIILNIILHLSTNKVDKSVITSLNLVNITGWLLWGFAVILIMGYGIN